jgi:pimeloyl-ACP methyl ester carboxylesterase
MAVIDSPAYTLVILSGTENEWQFAMQATSGFLGPQETPTLKTMQFWSNTATVISERLTDLGIPNDRRLFMAGHSYGAAVAAIVLVRIRSATPDRELKLLTFGCPKVSDDDGYQLIDAIEHTHVVNHGDFVPQFPISRVQSDWFPALIPLNIATNWNRWGQPQAVLLQDAFGTKEWDSLPALTHDILLPLVIRIMLGLPLDIVDVHLQQAYTNRSCLGCECPKYPLDEDVWAILFPFGCPAPVIADAALRLGNPNQNIGQVALKGVGHAVASVKLNLGVPMLGGIELVSPKTANHEQSIISITSPSRMGSVSLLMVKLGDCPCCDANETPDEFTVHLDAPGYPFHNQTSQLTRQVPPDVCQWRYTETIVVGNADLEVSSTEFLGAGRLSINLRWDRFLVGNYEIATDTIVDPMTCDPFGFTIVAPILSFGAPTGDNVTITVVSVP